MCTNSLHLVQHFAGIARIKGAIVAHWKVLIAAAHKLDIHIARLARGGGIAGGARKRIHIAATIRIAIAGTGHIT